MKTINLQLLFMCFAFFFTSNIIAQEMNKTITRANGKIDLIGLSDREGLKHEAFEEWFTYNYSNYEPNASLLKKIKGKAKGVSIDIFMGTWCGDSKREVPRFYKMLDEIGFSEKNIRLINLDKTQDAYKQSPNHEERGKLIHRVPTFIVYQKGKEIGRIVEFPVNSLEMDFAQILSGLPSDPNYKVVHQMDEYFKENGIPKEDKVILEFARKVYKSTPNDKALNTYGYVLMRRGDLEKAIAAFRVNAMLFSRNANVYDSLGEAYAENKEYEKALKMYEKVLTLKPNDENATKQIEMLESKVLKGR